MIGVIVKPPTETGAGAGAGSFIIGVMVKLPATTFLVISEALCTPA